MIKTFYFGTYTPNYRKAILKLINRMGWEIVCREEWGTIEKTVKIEVYIPEEDIDVFELTLGELS